MPGSVTQVLPSVATLVQAHSLQASRAGNVSCIKIIFSLDSGDNVCYFFAIQHQQQQQIVKVVTASPQAQNIMNAVQHVPISQAQQLPQVQKMNLCF